MTVTRDIRRDIQRDSRQTFGVSNGTPSRPVPSHSLSGSPSIHSVTQVTREASAEPVTDSQTSWMEEIDFEAEVSCAKRSCNNRADYLVMRQCKHCGWTQTQGHPEPKTQTCCTGHWLRMRSDPTLTWCRCGAHPRPDFFVIVEVLR